MTAAAALLSVLAFLFAFERFGVPGVASGAAKRGSRGFAVLRDPSLSDEEKEAAVREASFSLFKDVFSIGVRLLGAFIASLVPVLLFQWMGWATTSEVIRLLSSWPAIVGLSVAVTGWFLLKGLL